MCMHEHERGTDMWAREDALLLCFRFCIRHITDIKITIITLMRPDPAAAKSRQNFP